MSDEPDKLKIRSPADEYLGFVFYKIARTDAYKAGSSAGERFLAAIFDRRDNSAKNDPLSEKELDSVIAAFERAYHIEYVNKVAEATEAHPPDHILKKPVPKNEANYWWVNAGQNIGPDSTIIGLSREKK